MYNGGTVTDLSGTTSWAKRSGTRFNSRNRFKAENPIGAYNGHRRQMSISQFPGWKFARICKPAVRINCRSIQRVSTRDWRGGGCYGPMSLRQQVLMDEGGGRPTEERLKSAVKRFLLHHVVNAMIVPRFESFDWKFFFKSIFLDICKTV